MALVCHTRSCLPSYSEQTNLQLFIFYIRYFFCQVMLIALFQYKFDSAATTTTAKNCWRLFGGWPQSNRLHARAAISISSSYYFQMGIMSNFQLAIAFRSGRVTIKSCYRLPVQRFVVNCMCVGFFLSFKALFCIMTAFTLSKTTYGHKMIIQRDCNHRYIYTLF